MPTESTFLLAGLLFLAAALGYVFARFGDDDEKEEDESLRTGPVSADYVKGLNFLLDEKPDQALEVFMRMVEVDDETIETHFALGGLFRRRGEVERAIRVHQNLIARPNLTRQHRDQAFFALAEDYLSAGLFDRAEKLFQQMRESPEHSVEALRQLVRIYERTQDWGQAIDAFEELQRLDPEAAGEERVAHYTCELAERALQEGDLGEARKILKRAASGRRATVRARLLQAELAERTDMHADAIKLYEKVLESAPALISEVLPRLAASCRAADRGGKFSAAVQRLVDKDPEAKRSIAVAVVHDAGIDDPLALKCLYEFVEADSTLAELVDLRQIERADPEEWHQALERIRDALRQVAGRSARYRCENCGYATGALLWQCPGCRAWETVVPVERLNYSSFLG